MQKILFILIILLFFLSCGNESPIITNAIYNVLIYQKGSLNSPQDSIFLSVYFNIDDENGLDDIVEITVTHIETEYVWNLPVGIINKNTIWNEANYSGYSFLEYNNASSILTGEYLIEVQDKSGNIAEITFAVEIEGVLENTEYKIPEIRYAIESPDRKEIKIISDQYNSCEIKVLSDLNYFNGGRKKFKSGAKILLNEQPLPVNSNISIRINKDTDEKIVYFLKNYTLN